MAEEQQQGVVVNDTDLPDELVQEAVMTYFEENASVLGANSSVQFQTYANEGSLLARTKFRTPVNVFEEICLARDLAERDDDVAATIGSMLAIAYGEGMQHTHTDDVALALWDKLAAKANLDHVFQELYREWLIAGSVTTASLFVRQNVQIMPEGAERQRTRSLVIPRIAIIPAEQVRVIGNDSFGTGILAYKPATGAQETFLREFFASSTSAARKAQMRQQDPVMTTLLIEEIQQQDEPGLYLSDTSDPAYGSTLYRMNPRLTHRSTMPKGMWKYPRPPLTRNFALLEAKRLLNIMDFALLQGGSNFLVVAKKGSDQRPALPDEVRNLAGQVQRASRTGVLVGDHRLDIEIITPDLEELLSPKKRRLIGRKLAMGLLRISEREDDAGGEGAKAETETVQRVITADRLALRRHVENNVYEEASRRNEALLDTAGLWFPKILLAGGQWWTEFVLKMRDRGDISRQTSVEAGGFNYPSEVQRRKREKARGDDRVMVPAAVPFDSPNRGPQDNNSGRPPGSGPDNGRPGANSSSAPAQARPRRVIQRTSGETVRARFEDEVGTYYCGDLTYAVLEQYQDTRSIGRLTSFEKEALAAIALDPTCEPVREGPLTIMPVNPEFAIEEIRPIRLTDGLTMFAGKRVQRVNHPEAGEVDVGDGALVARAYGFREPEFGTLQAMEMTAQLGYEPAPIGPAPEPDES